MLSVARSAPAGHHPGAFARGLRWLRATDAGLARARLAARSVLAMLLGVAPALALFSAAGQPARQASFAGMLGMMAALSLPARRRAVHLLKLALACAASAAAASLLAPWPLASNAVFIAVMAAGAWATRWGPSGTAIGVAAFLAYVLPLFFRAGPAAAPWLVVAVTCGGIGAAAAGLWVFPHRPARELARTLPSLRARLERLVDAVVAAVAGGAPADERERLLERLASVQEVALQIDGLIEEIGPGGANPALDALRDEILQVEVLADHLVWSVLARTDDAAEPGEGARLSARWHGPSRGEIAAEVLIPVRREAWTATTERVLEQLAAALRRAQQIPWRHAAARARPSEREPETVDAAAPADVADARSTRRKVIQTSLAGAAAIALGAQLSPLYWYWAVIGAVVVIVTTPSRGAAFRKAVDRTLGTAVGVGVGLALGALLSDHSSLELVAMLALVFAAFWVLRVSYTWMMLLITVMIALLYDVMGMLTSEVLAVRLYETALGAAVGGVVAFFVLPSSTRSAVDAAVVKVLDALDELLACLEPGAAAPVVERIRQLDREVEALRTMTRPLVTSVPTAIGAEARAARLFASSARFRARALAAAMGAGDGPLAPRLDEPTTSVLRAVRGRLHALRGRLRPDEPRPAPPPGDLDAASGPVADILRTIDERLVAYRESRQLLE